MNLAIVQARMGSTRLPNKVLAEALPGIPMLQYLLKRVEQSRGINRVVIATTDLAEDQPIVTLCESMGVAYYRGQATDVLGRYAACADHFKGFENILRITGDCPLIDPHLVDLLLEGFKGSGCLYGSNILERTYPDGMDVEIFKRSLLEEANSKARSSYEREHVTPYMIIHDKITKFSLKGDIDLSHIRLTLDTKDDLEVIQFLTGKCTLGAGYLEYIDLLKKAPHLLSKAVVHLGKNKG